MTQKEADKLAWQIMENLVKDIPNVELVPSERTKRELLDDDNGEQKTGLTTEEIKHFEKLAEHYNKQFDK